MEKYTITDTSLEREYKAKNNPGVRAYSNSHKNGQRKLWIMELLFLKNYGHLSDTIIYAGASPGFHLERLIPLYPNHKWILYDPVEVRFDREANNINNVDIIIKQKYFTTEEAIKYKDKQCLFISDIRSLNQSDGAYTEVKKANKIISEDMILQRKCVEYGGFIASSLKFRLPWSEGITEYLDGTLYVQPWTGEFSPELRLFMSSTPTNIPICRQAYKKYNHLKLDNQMYYHNTITRRQNNYDNTYEAKILSL